ncbi:Calcium permease family membrane transporter [Taphrina deformans PYCC 5710]|uniref:Calcium permease family membrane transporter n=1 Tax=Taphrina deformans (strain PYCC 5710 / ATCC 11124 / CBS 356.35 / IMI 108563 / JCM 9778 / NBRC 8474) TaxID=1097556 RepID=R4X8K6_TAPDE|nr:Calcium permease family membrane transporter [Taphrina deformans PYCC 5710]|eukprot:CCG81954.1 Calcium permease family membrane transporter [Taphrina deformans PYCC 5710]
MEIEQDAKAVLSRTISDYARPRSNRHISSAGKSRAQDQSLRETDEYETEDEYAVPEEDILEEEVVEDDDQSTGSAESDESFTLKERQEAINKSHPFGIKIWKPAIYKKKRSVQKAVDGEIHSTPGKTNSNRFSPGNLLWAVLFGWWLCLAFLLVSMICYVSAGRSGRRYGNLCFGLARYAFYPFGQYVELKRSERYAEEDEGLGDDVRDLDDIEQFASGHNNHGLQSNLVGRSISSSSFGNQERDPLLGFVGARIATHDINPKRRAFGRGQWSMGRIIFFALFYSLIAPIMLIVSGICWLFVFPLPMAKVCYSLINHLRSHPLALTFHWSFQSSLMDGSPDRKVVLCTYRAMGWQYYKYTVDGTNIFFINLLAVVFFTIIDEYILTSLLGHGTWITSPALIFLLSLLSIIPLAYFIGQAVASISAQSSIGMGAAINAFFGSIVEVFLYCVALNQGKGLLVEGSIVGSILAGILLMPGLSMLGGAFIRKTQRFNAKSAGISSTMMLFAVIGAFGPTLFYQIYGSYELKCHGCHDGLHCTRCYFDQNTAISDPFYQRSVKPFTYICAILLALSYMVGLWFTLRTHAALIWTTPIHEEKPHYHVPSTPHTAIQAPSIKDMSHSIELPGTPHVAPKPASIRDMYVKKLMPHVAHAHTQGGTVEEHSKDLLKKVRLKHDPVTGETSILDSDVFYAKIADVAQQATTEALKRSDVLRSRRSKLSDLNQGVTNSPAGPSSGSRTQRLPEEPAQEADLPHGGHDAPNWSRTKSVIVLLTATVLYAIIAEILVDTVDVVLTNVQIEEKFLGFTLFALVPNTTEFMNAISFAMNGNIELSMEIGSAYALQVLLLQIPALVLFSAYKNWGVVDIPAFTFSLIFPRWDLVTVILCVILLSHVYSEGKSNYFKGSILIMSYIVVTVGFWEIPLREESKIVSEVFNLGV